MLMINFPIPVNLKVTGQVSAKKAKKRISINTNTTTATTSIHLPKPVSNDLIFSFNQPNPIGKDGVRSWSM